ncbi:MAG: 2-hydroxyacyl-CoA dehydratase family protein [Candidatus Caldarchaeum sp.]
MTTQSALTARPTAEEAGLDRAKQLQGELVKQYYRWVRDVKASGGKVAYCFVMANPIELLRAFNIAPVYPEITSLQISYRGGAPSVIGLSEEFGYSTDCCGYVKMGVATVLNKGQTPIGYIPTPDMAMLTYSGCQIYIHWWEQYQYITKTPVFTVDIPYIRNYNGGVPKHDIKYVSSQLEELIPKLEQFTGVRYDEEKLKEYIRLSAEAWELWKKCLHMGKLKPSPLDAYFEAIYYMSAITLLRGSRECVDFYAYLLKELQERYEKGVGPTPEERFRLVFEGVPNYPFFKRFWNLFKTWNARCVASTYPKVAGMVDVDVFKLNADKPLDSLAEYMIHAYCNWNMIMRKDLISKYVREYSADGVVIHSIKSCRSFSMGHGDIREYLIKNLDVPALHIESDHVDPRYYSEAQLKNRVDAFFESLSIRKRD